MVIGRKRIYHQLHKGPYNVFVRHKHNSDVKEVPPLLINKHVRDNYKSVSQVVATNLYKLKIIFDDFNEANHFITKSKISRKFDIYIPQTGVESVGIIPWSDEEFPEMDTTIGKYNNNQIADAKILEFSRIKKRTTENGNEILTNTTSVRVTFDSPLLPDYISLWNGFMTINVKQYKRKAMFCTRCLQYNHTSKRCDKEKTTTTDPSSLDKCIHCDETSHKTGDKMCPKNKAVRKQQQQTIKKLQQKTFAEMLKSLDPENIMPGEELSSPEEPPRKILKPARYTGTVRKQHQSKTSFIRPNSLPINQAGTSSTPKHHNNNKNAEKPKKDPPLGFKNAVPSEMQQSINETLQGIVTLLELPPSIAQIANALIVPYISHVLEKLLIAIEKKLTTSFEINLKSSSTPKNNH
jgi:hypothetical protein